ERIYGQDSAWAGYGKDARRIGSRIGTDGRKARHSAGKGLADLHLGVIALSADTRVRFCAMLRSLRHSLDQSSWTQPGNCLSRHLRAICLERQKYPQHHATSL